MEGVSGEDDGALSSRSVRTSRVLAMKRGRPGDGSSEESEVLEGVKDKEEPGDKFPIIISAVEGSKSLIFNNPIKLATVIGK